MRKERKLLRSVDITQTVFREFLLDAQSLDNCLRTTNKDAVVELWQEKTGAMESLSISRIGCFPLPDEGVFHIDVDMVGPNLLRSSLETLSEAGRCRGIKNTLCPYPGIQLKHLLFIPPKTEWSVIMPVEGINMDVLHQIHVFIEYEHYLGVAAIIASKLPEMGIDVTPDNIRWYRRKLVEKEYR
jgi:hypothetical protein